MKKAQIIAEIAKVHEGSLEKAFNLADLAIDCGADIIKFQYYDIDKMNPAHPNYKRYKKCQLRLLELVKLKAHIESKGKEFLVSSFNISLLEDIKRIGCTKIKVPSTYCYNKPFLRECINLFSNVWVSNGFIDIIKETSPQVDLYPDVFFNDKITMFRCVSLYPANIKSVLSRHVAIKEEGYSDHTIGVMGCIMNYLSGCYLIEKHFNPVETKNPWEMGELDLRGLRTLLDFYYENTKEYDVVKEQKKLKENFKFYKAEFPGEW